ncbi:MAG: chemotaxis-specific protein-glutamate methyltransferase CheB [Planctomycetota bacterium]
MKHGVLIVDDNAFLRKRLQELIDATPDLQVVGSAADPYQARDLLRQNTAAVMLLDLTMPRLDGMAFLEHIMRHRPMPVIVLSGLVADRPDLARRARSMGVNAVLAKPSAHQREVFERRLLECLREATRGKVASRPRPATVDTVIAIGASTGGTEALQTVMSSLPVSIPPVVLVQHMPAQFTAPFAKRLDHHAALSVRESVGGEQLQQGHAYLAPGDWHLVARQRGRYIELQLDDGPKVHYQRPAIDVTFASIARLQGIRLIGVILTGMGRDGAEGLTAIRAAGGRTLGQDAGSCVVYGMPKAAYDVGAVERQVTISGMAKAIVDLVSGHSQVE